MRSGGVTESVKFAAGAPQCGLTGGSVKGTTALPLVIRTADGLRKKGRKENMNLPNKLTMFRVFLIPFFVVFLLFDIAGGVDKWIALAIFVVASLTDLLDGKIARKYNLVTNFGKFMDPLADKLLVCSGLICLVALARIPAWIVIVIIAREFIISGFRLIAVEGGLVIAASYWGKFKTVFQMAMVILMIADIPQLSVVTAVVMWIALLLTVVSLVDYLWKNRQVLADYKS